MSIDATLDVASQDTSGHGTITPAMADLFFDAHPTPYLVPAARDSIDALAYEL